LWLDIDGKRAYPAFQIADDGLLPGMSAVVQAFAIDEPWMRVNFMLTGNARLGGRRPIDALREGQIGEVIEGHRDAAVMPGGGEVTGEIGQDRSPRD
jgi:hypothetical protein